MKSTLLFSSIAFLSGGCKEEHPPIPPVYETPREQDGITDNPSEDPLTNPPPSEGRPTNTTPNTSTPMATPVPGKKGYVFSPHNNRIVDVVGIPSGTLVQDPGYPPNAKKYFRVP